MLLHSSLEAPQLGGRSLQLYSSEEGLVALGWDPSDRPRLEKWLARHFDDVQLFPAAGGHELYRSQLTEYLSGRRRVFEFPVDLRGSPFQKAVWHAVLEVPFGHTASYGQIAEIVGRPRASRAVGAANQQNPVPIVVPCHRVVGGDGSATGFGGGIALKRKLLALEGLVDAPAVQMRLF